MPLVPSPTTVIIAELVLPGFADDLSTWVFAVDAGGTALQQAVVANVGNMFRDEPRTFATQLTPGEVTELLAAAADGGFAQLAEQYSAGIDDVPTKALAFRISGELKRVEVYGADFLACEGSKEMKFFCDLWRRIERHLPYDGA